MSYFMPAYRDVKLDTKSIPSETDPLKDEYRRALPLTPMA